MADSKEFTATFTPTKDFVDQIVSKVILEINPKIDELIKAQKQPKYVTKKWITENRNQSLGTVNNRITDGTYIAYKMNGKIQLLLEQIDQAIENRKSH